MADLSAFDLTGKKAFVTGGAMGIGRACATALARAGADVAIVDANVELAEKTAGAIRGIGREAIGIRCDVSDARQVQQMVDTVVARFGRLDIAVNNAGIFRAGDDATQSKEDWEQVIGVNLTGTWLCARAAMKQMIRQTPSQGKIINIASVSAFMACGNGSYDASKAGVVQLTRTLAVAWGGYNINVNCISPGYVVAALGTTRSLEERQRLREVTPLGHVQRAEDLYGPVLFLASSASDFVTGHNLIVDGGHTLSPWLAPLSRNMPPRVSPEEEVLELNRDLDARGIAHDRNGIILR